MWHHAWSGRLRAGGVLRAQRGRIEQAGLTWSYGGGGSLFAAG